MEIIIAVGIVAFISVYMFFKLGENTGKEHTPYQIILLGIVIWSIVVLGSAAFHSENCDTLLVNSTIINTTNSTTTFYDYDLVCHDSPAGTSTTFVKLTQWFYKLSIIYLLLYLIYKTLLSLNFDIKEFIRKKFK